MCKKTVLTLFVLMLMTGCQPPIPVTEEVISSVYALDAGGRHIGDLEVGSSLHIGAEGLEPERLYEFRLGIDGMAEDPKTVVSFARLAANTEGIVQPFILWYQSGVVGCSEQSEGRLQLSFTYRTFEEAEVLATSNLVVSVHPVQDDKEGAIPPMELEVGAAITSFELPITPRRSPMVYPSDETECLLNSREAQEGDMFVSGRNFEPGEGLLISVVPNQRLWYVGDPINDVTGVGGVAASIRVEADADGRFTARVWEAELQRHGQYDIVVQRELSDVIRQEVAAQDIISFASDTAYILYLRYPVGGPTMDIAGRPVSGPPYFRFADSFADISDPVWGAVDPTYVPAGHAGGTYAAYYVVDHRDVNGWDSTVGGATNLVDVTSSGIEIMPVKAGCINGTDIVIWNNPTRGDYDVVVDFGGTPAATYAAYATDANYDTPTDFLDGADQIGFVVAQDPLQMGTFPVGRAEYSQDDYFNTLFAGSTATNVDLRAVVRYPATSAGDNTPVAAGQHPIFIIEHGNHFFCEVDGTQTHATCPIASRTPNHHGYMNLLEVLASHGIIAVSIDAYDLTGWVPQWIPERGTLILKHLELWSHMNDASTYTSYPDIFAGRFAGRVDMNNIQVSGHSRGGEASVAAYMLNTSFNIGSVSSIAPVDGQAYTLPNVPYFVILPAADGDVNNLSGIRIYDRAGGSTDLTTKSGIYVYGANHNFFNTVWADDGDDSSSTRVDYIPKANQQKLGEAYLAAFARIHLLNEVVYEDMLRGLLTFPSTANYKLYHMRHEISHLKVDNGSGSDASASAGVTLTPTVGPSVHTTAALQVRWTAGGQELTFSLPSGSWNASTYEVLSFRVTQTNWSSNPASSGQDFLVELVAGSVIRAFYAGKFGVIPKPYDHPYFPNDHNVMTTIRIPLHSFIMNNSGLSLNNIDTIRFRFSNPVQGEIYVDDIEFSR